MKRFLPILLGTIVGQLLFKYVIEPKIDEHSKD